MRYVITETQQTETHRRTSNQARKSWREKNPAETRYDNVATEFVCVDGEGITLPDGMHKYVLLGVGNQQITNPDGLDFIECMEFLWSQFRTGSVAYTGFFLGYDFIQWFRSLPEERARMMLTAAGRAARQPRSSQRVQPFPVRYRGWEFDILGSKRFRMRKEGAERWMYICDTGPFFQKSFLKVIDPKEWSDPIVTPEEFEEVSRGKSRRSSAILDSDMLHYNSIENEILARVLCRLNEGFQSLGIHLRPNQWFGPGQAAQAWLKDRAITSARLQEITPRIVLEIARCSYFGGWFEIMAHGPIPGITWEYDINSAYPYIISQLPCLEHGEWIHNATTTSPYTLLYARVRSRNPYIGSMLHRNADGSIYRPDRTEGWYWEHELVAAKRAKLIYGKPDILDRWTYIPCDCPPPFREVRDIYDLRRKVGKKTPLGIACKLVPNSLYGKFAQSVGHPKYGNPIYASLITAGCRTLILNAIASHPGGYKSVLMVATDGVYFDTKHPSLNLSGNLGDWEENQKHNMCLFKPGVYWDDDARESIRKGDPAVFKARGVNARDFSRQLKEIDRQFDAMKNGQRLRHTSWPKVRFPISFAMVTAVQALQRNDWSLAGTIIPDATVMQDSWPFMKRGESGWENGILRTRPPTNPRDDDGVYGPSHPYEKRFGLDDPFSDEILEMGGITPDGYPGMIVKEGLIP